LTTASLLSDERPYPGLRPFGFEDSEFFFGREKQISALYKLLDLSRFVAVVGSSGSGKSSLVRAGLLPLLQREAASPGGRKWRFATLHPGDRPLEALRDAVLDLASQTDDPDDLPDVEIRRSRVEYTLNNSASAGLGLAIQNIRGLRDCSSFLVVDQFEELFRYATGEGKRAEAAWRDDAAYFVKLLLEATRDRSGSVYVLITMRSDFIGDCAQFYGLPEAVSATQFLVPSLTRDQREEVIRKPVERAGARIDPPLVERLLNDAGRQADQLPVLQHCLARLWEKAPQSGGKPHLTVAEYESIGGMEHALSRHAEAVRHAPELAGLDPVIQLVFRSLSERDKEGRATRRALPLRTLRDETGADQADLLKILDRFRADDCSFLVPARSERIVLRDETRIDVGHEALLRGWDAMSGDNGWLAQEEFDARRYRGLLALLEAGMV